MWSAIEKPTTRRLARSMQVARYSQPLVGADVRDVADVGAIEPVVLRVERPTQSIDHGGVRVRIGNGRPDRAPSRTASQAAQRHQPSDALAADAGSCVTESGRHARRAVRGPARGVDLDDPLGEPGVGEGAGPCFVVAPAIEGGARDLEQSAGGCHIALCDLPRLDERIHAHRASRAKKAVARDLDTMT
jgi:hypothetical protein